MRHETHLILSLQRIFISMGLLLMVFHSNAQTPKSNWAEEIKDSVVYLSREKSGLDILDMYRMVLRKAPRPKKWESPKKDKKKFKIALSSAGTFSLDTKLGAVLSANAAFYTDDKNDTKLSALKVSLSYNLNNQISLPIITNIWTKGNKLNLLGDWRYYKFPEHTYGLGGNTSTSKDADQLNYSNLVIHEAVLKKIGESIYIGPAYNLSWHWSIREGGRTDGDSSDLKKYDPSSNTVSSGVGIVALYDTRLNSINPADARYVSVSFCPYVKFLGSDNNYRSLIIDLRKYITPGDSKNVLAFWSYNWFTFNGHAPYLDLPSTGWDTYSNLGRGYHRSRFRGKNLLYLEAEYRFNMTRNGFLGGVVFANAQSVTDWPDNKFRSVYPAVGTGLRFKLNKHSNTNLCVDYGFGLDGSRGIFFNLGEVF